ncbi:hypothetical protein [Microtetraspora malaysiensis]|uniref:Uncharacterized protein n=1 Tax=Microtetraspora malaysiensis TaxID=161358 RepID=A0ABW6SHD4_9ACTN
MKRFGPAPISVREVRIFPEHIGPDEPLVPEFRDHRDAHVPWRLGAWLDDLGRHHRLLLYVAT